MTQFDRISFVGRSLSTLLILQTMETYGSQSGYSLLNMIKDRSKEILHPKAGTLYPQIDKLHQEGYLDRTIELSVSKSTKRTKEVAVYDLTPSGKKLYIELMQYWRETRSFIDNYLKGENK